MSEEEEGEVEGVGEGEGGEHSGDSATSQSHSEDVASSEAEDSMSISDDIDDAGDDQASSDEEDEDIDTALSALGWASEFLIAELRVTTMDPQLGIIAACREIDEARTALRGVSRRLRLLRARSLAAGDHSGSGDDGGLSNASDSLQDTIMPAEATREARSSGEQCPVCLHAAVNIALAPCGHFLCGSCLRHLRKPEVGNHGTQFDVVRRTLATYGICIHCQAFSPYSTNPFPDARQCPFCKAPIASSIQISQAHFTDVMSHICQFDDRCLGVNKMVQEGFEEEEDKEEEEEEEALLRQMAEDEEKSWMVAMAMAS